MSRGVVGQLAVIAAGRGLDIDISNATLKTVVRIASLQPWRNRANARENATQRCIAHGQIGAHGTRAQRHVEQAAEDTANDGCILLRIRQFLYYQIGLNWQGNMIRSIDRRKI